jgi:hypothetical protein
MSAAAAEILEQFRTLSLAERRELVRVLLREAEAAAGEPRCRRSLDDVIGKFAPLPEPEVKDHNYWFAEAILASKRGGDDL